MPRRLPAVVWARWEATMRWWVSHPGMQAWLVAKPAPLTADFEAFLNEMQRNDPTDAATAERWRRYVAGDDLPASSVKPPATAV